ncbi:MAG: ATP-binding protein [Solirubrobacteraceae bacterium]
METGEATLIGELLERLSRETDICLALLEDRGRVLYTNDAMAAINEGDVLISRSAVAQAAASGTPFNTTATTPDGRVWETRYVPMDHDGRRTVGVIARDITELDRLARRQRRIVKDSLEAAERERGRLADVLHDDVLQRLLFAHQEWASVPADPAVHRAIETVEDVTRRLRAVVSELHPITLTSTTLRSAVEGLARDHAARGSFTVKVTVSDRADGTHDLLVLAALRELLTNVAQHAPGAEAGVLVTPIDGELVIEVADDGPGFDPAVIDQHVGLAALFARIEASGGRTALESSADGTRVRLTLPVT